MRYAVNAAPGTDAATFLASLQAIDPGAVQPHPGVLYFEMTADATDAIKTQIESIGGAVSQCDADCPDTVRLDFIDVHTVQPVGADDWHLPYTSGDLTLQNYGYDLTGAGVPIYFVDTLMNPALPEFEGRAQVIHDPTAVPLTVDHGTATASWGAGKDHGVAKDALIFNAAGFDGAGNASISSINAALAAVLDHHALNFPGLPAILNCSFSASGFALGDPFAAVIDALDAAGVHVVCSSGNDGINFDGFNLTNVWPAMNTKTLTVGAHDNASARASFSNQGTVVGLHASGVSCAAVDRNGAIFVASGTSIAAPVVAGALACYIERGDADPVAALLADVTLGALTNKNSGPDGVLYKSPTLGQGGGGQPGPDPTPDPTGLEIVTIDSTGQVGQTPFVNLKGDPGPTGPAGADGQDGAPGAPGADGQNAPGYASIFWWGELEADVDLGGPMLPIPAFIPADFDGSGYVVRFQATPPTVDTVLEVRANGAPVGTITISPDGTVAASTNGALVSLPGPCELEIVPTAAPLGWDTLKLALKIDF